MSGGIVQHACPAVPRIEDAEEIADDTVECRRAHNGDFRITTDNDRVGVVARMAPPPCHRIAHNAKAGNVVDHRIHPGCLEGRAMAAFMPAAVHRTAIKHPVSQPERQRPKTWPQCDAGAGKGDHTSEQDHRVAHGGAILSAHQRLHFFSRHLRVIPLRGRQARRDGALRVGAQKAVITICQTVLLLSLGLGPSARLRDCKPKVGCPPIRRV